MATSQDKTSLTNRALLAVGARALVSSVDPSDGSVEGNAASILWQPTFEALGRTAHWNCLRRERKLGLLKAALGTPENPEGTTYPQPPSPWLYEYAYPEDCLDLWYIIPYLCPPNGLGIPATTYNNAAAPWVQNPGQIPYVVSTSLDKNESPIMTVLCNQSQAMAVYGWNQSNPSIWDTLFQQAFVASLAAYLVPALNLDIPLMDRVVKQAEEAIAVARAMDANEGVTSMDHLPDWMRARAGASGFGLWGINTFGGYYSMSWPSAFGGGSYGD